MVCFREAYGRGMEASEFDMEARRDKVGWFWIALHANGVMIPRIDFENGSFFQ